ncbi:MAG TPA: ABC transporter ATP-binding protein [candidate division Zixibacteria bacterium]|nr:ABC transporter ATP-binding protein [candidate division Zixibacteria bacterium]
MASILKLTISMLKKYLRPYIGQVVILALLLIIYNVIQITNPQIIRIYINAVNAPIIDKKVMLLSSIIYIGINIIYQGFSVLVNYLSQNLAWATTNDLRVDLTGHCMNLDMSFHNKMKTGEMIERIDGDASTLSEFFSTFIIYFLGSILLIFGIIIAVFIEGWEFGLIFTGFTIVALIAFYFVRKITSPLWKKVRESTTALYGNIEENISGLEDVSANGADEFIMRRFHEISQTNYKNKAKAMIFSRVYWLMNIVLWAVINITILVVSYYLSARLGLTTEGGGTLFLLLSYGTNLLFPLRLILWQIEQMQNSLANIERIDEFFNLKSKIIDEGTHKLVEDKIHLKFNKINFSYNDEDLVLQKISFDLTPERKLGLVGHTGCGKTTLARLIFRLHDPQSGEILINDINSRDYILKELRKSIAYVTQDVELFKASIKDNITFFDKTIPTEDVLRVINEVGLGSWLDQLENGLETVILSEECGLSAGEEQLLALSRAFLKNPKLVILDEASSRLDPATERQIDIALDKLMEGRSAIIIAHRLSTLHKVDDILILKKGEMVEYGERSHLASEPTSEFSKLLQKGIEEVLQ